MFKGSFGQEYAATPAITIDKSLCHLNINRHIEARAALCSARAQHALCLVYNGNIEFQRRQNKEELRMEANHVQPGDFNYCLYCVAPYNRQSSVL